jgi:hypothetical protein
MLKYKLEQMDLLVKYFESITKNGYKPNPVEFAEKFLDLEELMKDVDAQKLFAQFPQDEIMKLMNDIEKQ